MSCERDGFAGWLRARASNGRHAILLIVAIGRSGSVVSLGSCVAYR